MTISIAFDEHRAKEDYGVRARSTSQVRQSKVFFVLSQSLLFLLVFLKVFFRDAFSVLFCSRVLCDWFIAPSVDDFVRW